MTDTTSAAPRLLPCPFCGAGDTQIHVNKGTWTGQGFGDPVSVEVRHWCSQDTGQPSRRIVRVGRDEASAIAAWNRRTQPTPPDAPAPLTDEQIEAATGARRGAPLFLVAVGITRAVELAHGIGIKKGEGNG